MKVKWAGFVFALACPVIASAQEVTLDAPGADDRLMDLLRSAALTLELDPAEGADPQDYVAAARADYRRLLTALYSDGYYSGTISIRVDGREADSIAPLDAPARVSRIAINVTPGPQFVFGRTEINPLAPDTALPDSFAPGEPARADEIRQAVRAAITSWREAGHAKAETAGQQITARHPQQVLDAQVQIAPGPQLTFGAVTISGNNLVRTSAIRRIAGVPEGEVFTPQALDDAAARLRETGAFASVALVESDTIGAGNTLPIDLQVSEAKLRRLGAGVEYSSVDGLTVSSYFLHRNALGGAERFRADIEIAGIGGETGGTDYSISSSLGIPAIYKTETDFLATASISREDEPDYLVDKVSVETRLSRDIPGDKTAVIGVGVLAAHEETAAGQRDYILLTFPLEGTIDKRDDPTNAKNGYYVNLELTPFLGILGDATGGLVYADARAYRSFGTDDRFTLAARTQLGSVIGPDETEAPAEFLFFSGGGGTVRGQGYKSLGLDTTIDGTPVTTGGTSFAGVQLEARVDVTERIGVVGFYDYGYVGASALPLRDGQSHAGAGLGIRYDTGIGPIRLDVGTPTTGDRAYDSVQVYIGIGQSF